MEQPIVPPKGFTLSFEPSEHQPLLLSSKTQILRLDLLQDKTREILKSLRNGENVRLHCGKQPNISYGKQSFVVNHEAQPFSSELFVRRDNNTDTMYFSGRVSHSLEAQRAQADTKKTDSALAALENSLKSIQEQKASNETSFVRNKAEMSALGKKPQQKTSRLHSLNPTPLRRDHLINGITRSTPASPFLAASFSRPAPTSVPTPSSGISNTDRIRLNAIRVPLVHLLALAPSTVKSLAGQVHASIEDCEKVLNKIARDSVKVPGKLELKEKSYRELDVWKFPYKTVSDRQTVLDHAVHAYDRMRIEKSDPLWQLLLSNEERGKGKSLSKLNLDRPAAAKQTAKSSEDDAVTGESDSSRDKLQAYGHAQSRAHSNDPLHRKKVSEKENVSKQVKKSAMGQLRDASQSRSNAKKRVATSTAKYKSAEIIEDSDEEVEAANNVVVKPIPMQRKERASPAVARSEQQSPRNHGPVHPLKQSHKPKLSSSSEDGRGHELSYHKNEEGKPKTGARAEQSTSQTSSRPRKISSPQKPSPLASSPPTNSTDLDNSSSDKASTHSSAPTSPPSSTDIQKSQRHLSPVKVQDRDGHERGRSPVKRKADTSTEQPAPKRLQVDRVGIEPPQKVDTDTPGHRPKPVRHATDTSGSSLSPEKPEHQTEEVVDKSKRFQLYYRRYKEMHERITTEHIEDEQELEELWKMHNRLKELKEEIWRDWRGLGEPKSIAI